MPRIAPLWKKDVEDMATTSIIDISSIDLAPDPILERAISELADCPRDLGVSFTLLPRETTFALDDIVPPPAPPKRERKQVERYHKPYVKTCGTSMVDACLSLAVQPDRFATTYIRIAAIQSELPFWETEEGRVFAGLAILAIRGLADLAKKAGLSYAQTQQIVSILVILGFVKRFRFGRKFIYAIPLFPYTPEPSPEVVRDKLNVLLQEIDLEEGEKKAVSKSAIGKRSHYRKLVEAVKLRFEARYGLGPDQDMIAQFQSDPEYQEALHEIQAVLTPDVRAAAMPKIARIVAKHFVGRKRGRFVQSVIGDQHEERTEANGELFSDVSLDLLAASQSSLQPVSRRKHDRKAIEGPVVESVLVDSTVFVENEHHTGAFSSMQSDTKTVETLESTSSVQASVDDFPGLFSDGDQECEASTDVGCELREDDLVVQSEFLALSLEEDWVEIEEQGRKVRVTWVEVEEKGKKIKLSCFDPAFKLRKAGCHKKTLRTTPLMIAKAAFVYTLLYARSKRIETTRAGFFTKMCRIWKKHGTYEGACKANKQSWGTTKPAGRGIPRSVREVLRVFGHCSFEELERVLGRCTDKELQHLLNEGIPPSFAWSLSSLAETPGGTSDCDIWLMSLLESSAPRTGTMSMADAQKVECAIGKGVPAGFFEDVAICEVSSGRYAVQIVVHARKYLFLSEQEWEQYLANLRRITELKRQLGLIGH